MLYASYAAIRWIIGSTKNAKMIPIPVRTSGVTISIRSKKITPPLTTSPDNAWPSPGIINEAMPATNGFIDSLLVIGVVFVSYSGSNNVTKRLILINYHISSYDKYDITVTQSKLSSDVLCWLNSIPEQFGNSSFSGHPSQSSSEVTPLYTM